MEHGIFTLELGRGRYFRPLSVFGIFFPIFLKVVIGIGISILKYYGIGSVSVLPTHH